MRARRSFLVFVIAACAATVMPARAGLPVAGGLLDPLLGPILDPLLGQPHDIPADEQYFVTRINEERDARGLGKVRVHGDLAAAAKRQSDRMAAKLEIWHNLNLENEIGGWLTIGENVGWSRTTIQDLHQAFMDSPEHRENILWPVFNEIGIGETIASDGRIFVTEVFAERHSRSAARVLPRRIPPRDPAPVVEIPEQPRTLSLLLELLALDAG